MRTIVLLLALVGVAMAAPPRAVKLEVTGDTVTVVRSFPVQVTAAPGADIYVWQFPDGVRGEAVDGVLTVTAAPKGVHRVTITRLTFVFNESSKKWDKVRGTGETTLVVGELPAPPGPGPNPPAPGPLSPLAKALRDAAGGDVAGLKSLAAFYAESGLYLDVDAINTGRKLQERMRADALKLVPADRLVKVRELIADEYARAMPADPDQPFTFDTRGVARGLFKAVAQALEEAAR